MGDDADDDGASTQELRNLKMPLHADRLRKHFRIPPGTLLPTEPDRVSNITVEQFREYALRGQPVIVTDGMRDWAGMGKWNCDYFHKTFPNEDVGGFTAFKADALKWRRKLGDAWFQQKELLNVPEEEADPKNPTTMSWYWSAIGIDGTRGHETNRNQTVVDMIKRDFSLPYFLEDTAVNRETVAGRVEFFFGTEGAGVHPHTDPVCQWIFSGQAAGHKMWRLSLPYNIDALEEANPGYKFQASDGNELLALMMNRASVYEFTMHPGEVIFFPPGLIHTTRAVGPECSTSFSMQFASPNPVEYVKEFAPDLISDIVGASRCFVDHFDNWLFGDSIPNREGTPEANKRSADRIFADMDADGSGLISADEATTHFTAILEDVGSAGGLVSDDPQLDVVSFVLAHDTDGDGKVSRAEYDVVLEKLWTPRMASIAAVTEKPNTVSYFYDADKDSNDYVTEAEMKAAFPDINWSDVLQYDDDGDGRLFQGELHNHVNELHKLFSGEDLDMEPIVSAEDSDGQGADSDSVNGVLGEPDDEPPAPPAGGLGGLSLELSDEQGLRDFWAIGGSQGQLPVPIDSLTSTTAGEFRARASSGRPLIVEDGMRNVDLSQWTFKTLKERLAGEELQNCEGCSWKTLGETNSSVAAAMWEVQPVGRLTVIGAETPERSQDTVAQLQANAKIPYYLPHSQINTDLHSDHLRIFFGSRAGTLGPISDMNCFWSVYSQAQGESHWRITMPYDVFQLQEDNSDYTYWAPDGATLIERMINEHAVYMFTLRQGQQLVLPPGMLKDFVMQGAGVSVMYRTAFMDPAPVAYVKHFQSALMSDSDGAAGCYTDHYNRWIMGSLLPSSDGSDVANNKYAKEHFAVMDADRDARISLSEAVASFPEAEHSGAVRAPELDGQAFIEANDVNNDGFVDASELTASVQSAWTPIVAHVGSMWFHIDARNADEGGSWEDYGRFVDSIRFLEERKEALFFDDDKGSAPLPLDQVLPSMRPSRADSAGPVTPECGLILEHPRPGVTVARSVAQLNYSFVMWAKPRHYFVGPLTADGSRRLGAGAFCCSPEGDVMDQKWAPQADDGKSWLPEPSTDSPLATQDMRADLEIIHDMPGFVWMGPASLTGIGLVHWHETGDTYLGTWEDGRRIGQGIFEDASGKQELQEWRQGDDEYDWVQLF